MSEVPDDGTSVCQAPRRLLIVEDNEALAQTVGWMAETAGYDYLVCESADQALASATEYAPHVAILDIGLPGMSGFELCRRLRALPAFKDVRFIAQTGNTSDEYRHHARNVGFDYYVMKPVSLENLHNILKASS